MQVDFRPVVQRPLEVRLAARLQRRDRALQHVHVHREADLLDLAALLLAEQLAGAADLQVVRGQHEAGAEFLQRLDGLEALAPRPAVSALRGGTSR